MANDITRELNQSGIYPAILDAKKLVVFKDKNGKDVLLPEFLKTVEKAAKFISKIEGDIFGASLIKYKSQTSVYSQKIEKNETTQFQITPGSAFKLRSCC